MTRSLPTWPPPLRAGSAGQVGIVPRLYLRKLIAEVLDLVELYPDFRPREHAVSVRVEEMTDAERHAAAPTAALTPDDIPL